MSYAYGTLWYADEMQARARELGWPDYDTAIQDMYLIEELSFRQTARWFNRTDQAIKERLQNQVPGFQARPRGGLNRRLKPWDTKWRNA